MNVRIQQCIPGQADCSAIGHEARGPPMQVVLILPKHVGSDLVTRVRRAVVEENFAVVDEGCQSPYVSVS